MAKPGLDSGAKGGLSELKSRLFVRLWGDYVVFRLGSYVPIPGIDPAVLADLFEQQKGTIVEMFNMFSGGALERASVLALGYHALYFSVNHHAVADCCASTDDGTEKRRRSWSS